MIIKERFGEYIFTLEPGDVIVCGDYRAEIKEIDFQEYWSGHGFITEFYDTDGVYRNWKQEVDGGKVIPKRTKYENM